MNKKHAEEGSLLFDDERTLKEHVADALAGKQ